MPGKVARSDPRPSARVTRGAGSGQLLASVLQEGRENANIESVWDSSGESRLKNVLWAPLQIRSSGFLRFWGVLGRPPAVVGEPPALAPGQLDQLIVPQPVGNTLRPPFDWSPVLDPSGAYCDILERHSIALFHHSAHHGFLLCPFGP